ncbi:MAG: Crp/Fnr family transcriptional regulator [Clostridia bacterium]|nr:Crp/Fnr family transcriptional regulator [Clostridia bacterium]
MIDKNTDVLMKSILFKGIESDNLAHLLGCLNPTVREYGKNDIVAVEGTNLDGIGVVLEGSLSISKTSLTGNRILLGTAEPGELFGENAAYAPNSIWPANVESQTASVVMFVKPDSIVNQCAETCAWHGQLQKNMLEILSAKALKLTKKIEYLAIKGLKAKICTYLYSIYLNTGKKEFDLPLKKYELAEFFNSARPSLSREMINLREEGVIDFTGARIMLLDLSRIEGIIDGLE